MGWILVPTTLITSLVLHLDDASEYERAPPPAFTFNLDYWDS